MLDIVTTAVQSVTAQSSVIFNNTRIKKGCNERHEQGSSRVVLLKPGVYEIAFSGDIAIPTGGAIIPISVGIAQDGEVVAGSISTQTPTVVNSMAHVSTTILAQVYGCGNSAISVVNTGAGTISVQNANLVVTRKC